MLNSFKPIKMKKKNYTSDVDRQSKQKLEKTQNERKFLLIYQHWVISVLDGVWQRTSVLNKGSR